VFKCHPTDLGSCASFRSMDEVHVGLWAVRHESDKRADMCSMLCWAMYRLVSSGPSGLDASSCCALSCGERGPICR
jgi:hypothetical protein